MLVSAYFNSRKLSESDFDWFFDFNYGNCYRFNSNESNYRYSGIDGASSFLELELYLGNSSEIQPFTSERGIKLLINNNTDRPYPYDYGINISPGKKANIKVKRSYFNRLGPPYSKCLTDLTPNNPDKTLFMKIMFDYMKEKSYTHKFCMRVCFQAFVSRKCNCSDPAFPTYRAPPCKNIDQVRCLEKQYEIYSSDPKEVCQNNCSNGNLKNFQKLINF